MDFNGFRLFPAEGRLVDTAEQRAVGSTLEDAKVLDHISAGPHVTVEVGRNIAAGLTPAAAHYEWREEYFPHVETPPGLPRQALDAQTPSGLVHVTVSVIEQHTPGMGSHFGFQGYFLSLLVSVDDKRIWDARGERAT